MNFLESIFYRCNQAASRPVIQEVRDGQITAASGAELLGMIQAARVFLNKAGLRKGDRCALVAPNSIRWVALDLAIMYEGGIAVPLYARQAPSELAEMMKDCSPSLICSADEKLRSAIDKCWDQAPPSFVMDDVFPGGAGTNSVKSGSTTAGVPIAGGGNGPFSDRDPATIIYTSGTSGEAKGVVLTAGNLNHMLRCTSGRLELLMGSGGGEDRVFHYLPFCFAGSWILLLTCLSRNSLLTMSTDLSRLSEELRVAAPDYFLNVPALLDRMRAGIEGQFKEWGGFRQRSFENGEEAWHRRRAGKSSPLDSLWLILANAMIFPAIKKKISRNLKALICGSAPLAIETQLFFTMLGLPVLQVYGLTETTAICTMDHPHRVEPGRVGPAIEEVEMKLGEGDEILVRGPNIFQGYWNRPQATTDILREGWFHTGDQGEVDDTGNWRITGRIKNLIVLGSGHNVAPEPLEETLLRNLPGAQQVLVVGNGRSFLSAIVTGETSHAQVEQALEAINPQLPHYKRVRAFYIHQQPFTVDNGLLTANGKLKRGLIAERFREQIEELYRDRTA